ncbi:MULTISPECIES: mannose-6-phosphate isomerase, class I [Microbacterium]|uniref:mannose-6-phosphate isomerase n=1 Tax=Microbacterium saccharophilum TaxID=1213358 RepID=A0A7Z7D0U2_9MICO|nr:MULTISPECIES: mannose-6-phosphate isomerase, class I [Microbacterium]SFI64080.1 mannose-6-phosphate isomerase, type 1 [Microbacterium saccharophilum]
MLIGLTNEPRDYSWGSETLIPALVGRPPGGRPEAEIWYGDHPGCPARVADGSGRTLDELVADRGEAPLPYLLKLLAAGSSLSIQAHPSLAEAVAGFARENAAGIPLDAPERTYRDANHKPEIIVAVSEVFRALVGLRPLEETRRLLAALGDAPGVAALAGRLSAPGEDADVLRATIEWALSGQAQAEIDDLVVALRRASSADFAAELDVLRAAAEDFPGDPGIVVALLMNLVDLRRGEALFAPAGVLHAYQAGLGVELMAASDNVLRGGLTPKHIDVPELMRIVDTTPGPAPLVTPVTADGAEVFDVGIPDFVLVHAAVQPDRPQRVALAGAAIVLVTGGEVTVTATAGSVVLRPAEAAYLTADEASVELTGEGDVFLAQPGRG